MIQIMKNAFPLILLMAVILMFPSCEEDGTETDYNPNVKSSRDYIYAEDIYFEVVNVFLKGITDTAVLNSYYNYLDNCAIYYQPVLKRMQFDYGNVNRWCPDNKFRRGKFIATFDGGLFTEGSSVVIQLDSLTVDEELIEGNLSCEFLGTGTNGKHQIIFRLTDGLITLNDTVNVSTIFFESEYTFTWEEGQSTPALHEDDIFSVSGTASGRSVDQYAFEIMISDPLIDALDCFWIVSGTHQITVPGASVVTGSIDYITSDNCFYQVNFLFGESEFYDYLKF